MASEPVTRRDVTFSQHVPAIPMEDVKPGDVIHHKQANIIDVTRERVYELAKTGLGHTKVAALLDISYHALMDNFPKTLEKARADRAIELWHKLWEKAQDDQVKGDMGAIKMLLNRLDPEPKEPTVLVQQNFNIPQPLADIPLDELSNLVITTVKSE